MQKQRSTHLLAAAALACLAAGPAAGGTVGAQHVVSTNLCTDEYAFRLLPRARIAALSVLAGETNPQVSTIAGRIGDLALIRPNAEEVLARHPDLVLLYQGVNPRLKAQLQEAHVAVFEVPWAEDLAAVRRVTTLLGERLGAPDKARALLLQMETDLALAKAQAPANPVRTVIYEPNGYAASGAVSDALMRAGGLINAAPRLTTTRSGTLPVEALIAAAPRLLIVDRETGTGPALADVPLTHPALAALAGKTRIVRTALTALLCPGPWSASVALRFARYGRLAGQPQPR